MIRIADYADGYFVVLPHVAGSCRYAGATKMAEEDTQRRGFTPLELKQKISVPAAAALNGLSLDTFARFYKHLIRKVSPRRNVVELGDAIDLPAARAAPASTTRD